MKKLIIGLARTIPCVAAVLLVSETAQALTLIAKVNPNTWAVVSYDGTGEHYVDDYDADRTDAYNNVYHRYYTAGLFDTVVIENNNTGATLAVLQDCNNIFYIDRTTKTAHYCSTGYNGAGNGVDGRVFDAKAFKNGDLYIAGEFTSAGNRSFTSYFSCYRWSEGWNGIGGVYADDVAYALSFDGYRLRLDGFFTTIYGPFSSGGSHGSASVSNLAYWNEWHYAFPDNFWETQ